MIKMKNSSIRKRVTLYYSMVLIIITFLLFSAFLLIMNRQVNVVSKNTVMQAVMNSFDNVDYGNNIIEIDDDFDIYQKGVTLLVYSEKGELIKGAVPSSFPVSTPLTTGEYEEIKSGPNTWLVYDLYNMYENGQGLWVRGIYAMDSTVSTLNSIIFTMVLALPLILLIAILAGQRITKRAFAPVAEITSAANSIGSGNDLSKRLPQGESRDELYDLTITLNAMISRLEEAFLSEKQFSSDVSHELKTPVSVILAECEYILQENRRIEEYKESLEVIQKQCKRTMSLIQQLLQISRTIDKEKTLEKETFDLSILCQSIVSELSLVAEEKGIFLSSRITPDIQFCGDETLIMRMILNLLTNGIKYSRTASETGPAEKPWVTLTLSKADRIVIIIEDNGIGIRQEDLSNIFHRFYKVDKARKEEKDSFGLGLAMVKWIVEAHNGQISVESIIGKGSRFTVTL